MDNAIWKFFISLNWELIVAVLIASIPGIISLFKDRKVNEADAKDREASAEDRRASAKDREASAAERLVDTSMELLKNVEKRVQEAERDIGILKVNAVRDQAEIENLKCQVERYKRTQNLLIRGIKILVKQLEENQIKPAWQPKFDELEIL